jgi:hypothetical protein
MLPVDLNSVHRYGLDRATWVAKSIIKIERQAAFGARRLRSSITGAISHGRAF